MRRLLAIAAALFALPLAYFLLWPVPVDPVAWDAPEDRGYVDPFAINDLLKSAYLIDIAPFDGPEDAALGTDGAVYVTTLSGHVARVLNGRVSEHAYTGGRPLGIEALIDGTLLVANSMLGLQRVGTDGSVELLLDTLPDGSRVYPNNLAVLPDGRIAFSESSSKFSAGKTLGTYDASLLDILEHGGHGRLFLFDPVAGSVSTLLDGLNYANGVAADPDGRFVLVAETGHYRVLKHWLSGDSAGSTEVVIDNLPGFPDNLKTGLNGRFWLGFAAPRNDLVDALSNRPFVRKIIQRLPSVLRPAAVPSSHVIAFDADGTVLMNLHDPDARVPTLTGVLETSRSLYLTTLFGKYLPRVDKRDL